MLQNRGLQLFNGHRVGMYALRASVCLFVICGVSAGKWDTSKLQFRFFKDLGFIYRRSAESDGCILCYGGKDCIVMNIYRCQYYLATTDIVDNPESVEDPVVPVPQLRAEVDSMLFDLVDKASRDPRNKDCIPYISHFTDCTRENICVGCKSCECDEKGSWTCTVVQKCRADAGLHADHRTLVTVLENLRNVDTNVNRVKRSDAQLPSTSSTQISYVQLAEWMYGAPPAGVRTDSSEIMKMPERSTLDENTETTTFDNRTLVTESKENVTETETGKISSADISEWVNEFHPFYLNTANDSTASVNPISVLNMFTENYTATTERVIEEVKMPQVNTEATTAQNSENLDFEEVLSSLAVENRTNIRRKPLLDMNHNEIVFNQDYVNYGEDMNNYFEFSDPFVQLPNNYGSTVTEATITGATKPEEAITEAVTEIVIDLLESAKLKDVMNYRNGKSIVFTDYFDSNDSYMPQFEETNNIDQLNAVNVMKRDVSFVTTTDVTTASTPNINVKNYTLVSLSNITEKVQELRKLKTQVLHPLNDIINNKHREIEELFRIQKNLIAYFNNYKDLDINVTGNNNTEKEPTPLLKVEDTSVNLPHNLRTNNVTLLDKYLTKLKRDVYEVIRDIVGIRQLSDPTNIPEDIKFLMHAMKFYVQKQSFHLENKRKSLKHRSFRRKTKTYDHDLQTKSELDSYEQRNLYSKRKSDSRERSDLYSRGKLATYDQSAFNTECVKTRVIKIIEAIDRNMPLSNSLNPLSPDANKVIKRIIKRHYIDELSVVGLKVYDPHYNLTNDLRNIGTKWQDMAADIKISAPSDKLYAMKLLHIELSTDMTKLKDALALINFAHTRRMVPVEENIGQSIISKIKNDLVDIGKQISNTFNSDYNNKQKVDTLRIKAHQTRKPKISFFKHIKHLLKSSKNDILGLFRKKIPKSEIFKELARKQLDVLTRRKLSEHERTMQKWQYNLGIVTPRIKRSVTDFDKIRNRIKNILPKYLRGKVPNKASKSSKKNKPKQTNIKAHRTKETAAM